MPPARVGQQLARRPTPRPARCRSPAPGNGSRGDQHLSLPDAARSRRATACGSRPATARAATNTSACPMSPARAGQQRARRPTRRPAQCRPLAPGNSLHGEQHVGLPDTTRPRRATTRAASNTSACPLPPARVGQQLARRPTPRPARCRPLAPGDNCRAAPRGGPASARSRRRTALGDRAACSAARSTAGGSTPWRGRGRRTCPPRCRGRAIGRPAGPPLWLGERDGDARRRSCWSARAQSTAVARRARRAALLLGERGNVGRGGGRSCWSAAPVGRRARRPGRFAPSPGRFIAGVLHRRGASSPVLHRWGASSLGRFIAGGASSPGTLHRRGASHHHRAHGAIARAPSDSPRAEQQLVRREHRGRPDACGCAQQQLARRATARTLGATARAPSNTAADPTPLGSAEQ